MISTDDAARPVKPKAPRPNLENIPAELRDLRQWVVWRYEFRDGDWTKVPYNPQTGTRAKSNDSATWGTLDEAVRAMSQYDGIGFQFGDCGFVGIDLDDCRDPATGNLTPFAEGMIERFATYSEVSPSGKGVKLFIHGTWSGTGKNRRINGTDRIEVYPRGRYFTFTGAKLPCASVTVRECQHELDALHAEHFALKPLATNGNGCHTSGNAIGRDRSPIIERAAKYLAKMPAAISGQQGHNRAFHAACTLVQGFGLSDDEAWGVLCEWNASNEPPFSERDLRHKLDDANKQPGPRGTLLVSTGAAVSGVASTSATISTGPSRFPSTDLGNARRLVAAHGRDIRFCHQWNKWLIWDGIRWRIDETGEVTRRAKSVIDEMWAAVGSTPEVERKDFAKHVIASSRSDRIAAMVKLAQSEPGIPVVPNELDQDPWLLNCPNGTVDLRNGTHREHQRGDLLTKCTAAQFNADAGSYVWDRFLESVFDGKEDLIQFVQRFCGYALCGQIMEHVLAVFHGRGANGKSTLLEAFMHALGPDYSTKGAPTCCS